MAGHFRRVKTVPFPSKGVSLNCGIYEWSAGNPKKHGNFKIRFLSPDEPGPRTYDVQPLMGLWFAGKPTRFLEQACAYGLHVLNELEPLSPGALGAYKVWQAIFRNRHEGHTGIGRLFKGPLDFLDWTPGGRPVVIAPGLEPRDEAGRRNPGTSITAIANRVLRSALEAGGRPPEKEQVKSSDILAFYVRQLRQLHAGKVEGGREGSVSVPFHELPGKGKIDLVFTDGLVRNSAPWKSADAVAKIRSSLIGVYSQSEDYNKSDEKEKNTLDTDFIKKFYRRLWRAMNSKTPRAFDSWLAQARSYHGLLSLVEAIRLKGVERKTAMHKAHRLYTDALWLAYQHMARCYGALMLVVYLDFCLHGEHQPDPEERWLFRQRHFPQLYLAGLPLDFLTTPQLRWIICLLRDYWDRRVVEPQAYDLFTDLLGIFGSLTQMRREADRRRKHQPSSNYMVTVDPRVISETEGRYDPENLCAENKMPAQHLTSTQCPHCGTKLQLNRCIEEIVPKKQIQAELWCPTCEEHREYIVDIESWTNG